MAGDDNERQPSFKVQDRRRFSATGEARDDAPEGHTDTAPGPAAAAPSAAVTPPEPEAGSEITFASFVFSLSTQALVHLGEIADPVDGGTRVQLEGARQIIDILAVLSEKTRGNLDPAESSLLESALYDLRMRYVERAHAQ